MGALVYISYPKVEKGFVKNLLKCSQEKPKCIIAGKLYYYVAKFSECYTQMGPKWTDYLLSIFFHGESKMEKKKKKDSFSLEVGTVSINHSLSCRIFILLSALVSW